MSATDVLHVLHPVLATRDFEHTLAFYRDCLGLSAAGPVLHHDPHYLRSLGGPSDAVAKAVILKAPDGTEIEVACFEQPEGQSRTHASWADAGIRSVTFVVTDIDAMVDKMAAAQYPLLGQIVPTAEDNGRGRICYVLGPDGVIVTLLQTRGASE